MGFGGGLRLQAGFGMVGVGLFYSGRVCCLRENDPGYDHALNAMPTWLGPSLFNIGADYWPVLSSKMQTGILRYVSTMQFREAFSVNAFSTRGDVFCKCEKDTLYCS
ncbi:hypothetical protein NC652_022403 [Populus alba x Populus x berolinensis]|nr:hypothetical protein NC652_022403 [Populus alba x Populus x berolinensis]